MLGIFGFDRILFGKAKDKKWWMELRRNKMNDMQAEVDARLSNRLIKVRIQSSEIVAYHKVKRIFLNLMDMEKENPDEIQMYEFKGQNFELIVD